MNYTALLLSLSARYSLVVPCFLYMTNMFVLGLL